MNGARKYSIHDLMQRCIQRLLYTVHVYTIFWIWYGFPETFEPPETSMFHGSKNKVEHSGKNRSTWRRFVVNFENVTPSAGKVNRGGLA